MKILKTLKNVLGYSNEKVKNLSNGYAIECFDHDVNDFNPDPKTCDKEAL